MPAHPELLPAPLGAGVLAGFALRTGGVSEAPYDSLNLALTVGDDPVVVRANRAALLAAVAPGAVAVCWAEQVHGADVAAVTAAVAVGTAEGGVPAVDALVTATPGVLLCIRVADCLPVLFADSGAAVIGAAHAGRRGLAAGVLRNTVLAMEALGASRAGIRAVVGPGICGRCYEVPEALAAEIDALIPGSRTTTRTGTPSLDLAAAAGIALGALGLASVDVVDECTAEQPDRWYSYRRARRTGRFVGYVALA